MAFFDDIGAFFGFGDGLGGYEDPTVDAMETLQQIPGMLEQYYDPYIQGGLPAFQQLGQQGQQMGTPTGATDALNQMIQSYQTSPYQQYLQDQALQYSNQAAAAGGRAGIPTEQAAVAQQIADISQQGLNDYLRQALGLYGTGLNTLGGVSQTGYGASTGLASDLGSNLMTQANLQYSGALGEQAAREAAEQRGGGLIGSLVGGGLGFLAGGPAGAMTGAQMGGNLSSML
jgi:hypothetical protein